jgi:hypothetical protein
MKEEQSGAMQMVRGLKVLIQAETVELL